MVKLLDVSPYVGETKQVVDKIIENIKTDHIYDLGIALEWTDAKPEPNRVAILQKALDERDPDAIIKAIYPDSNL